jgi:hypothetical protein
MREILESKTKGELVKIARDFNHLFQIKGAQKLLKSRLIDELMKYENMLKPHINSSKPISKLKKELGYKKKKVVKKEKNEAINKLIEKQLEYTEKSLKGNIDEKFENMKKAEKIGKQISEMMKETRAEKSISDTKRMLRQNPKGQKILKKMEKEEKKQRKEEREKRKAKKENPEKRKLKKQIEEEKQYLKTVKERLAQFKTGKRTKEIVKLLKDVYGVATPDKYNKMREKYLNYETETEEKIKKLKAKYNSL